MIVGILLAGGASTRFGSPKLLHVLPNGLVIAEQSARNLLNAVDRVMAVTRPGDDELAEVLRKAGCEVLVTPRAREGMGASLAAAVDATKDADAWIVALADMPFIDSVTILQVRNALEAGAAVAAPALPGGERGHPVGFAASLLGELTALSGDRGAREIVARYASAMKTLTCEDRGIVIDIDRPLDLER